MERLPRVVEHLSWIPGEDYPGLAGGTAYAVIDALIDFPIDDQVDRLEAYRLASSCESAIVARDYAIQNDLVRQSGRRLTLTRLGEALLQLQGREAVRWLLVIEVGGCLGNDDPFRTSPALLHAALADGGLDTSDAYEAASFPFAYESVRRLVSLRVLGARGPVDAPSAYQVLPELRNLVESVLNDDVWHVAIRALRTDEQRAAVPAFGFGASSAESLKEQSRMMAHEVRNALVPVRLHLDALISSGTLDASRAERARRGVVRVLDFVDQLVTTADMLDEPSRRYDLVVLLTEAYHRMDGHDRVEVDEPTCAYFVTVPRQRFIVALTNLLQNALQFAPPPGPIRVSWHDAADELHVRIDDGGPGVPLSDRTRIFDDGYTTRPGGSGFGLAYVRKVVETSLHGRVWCEDSDLGGARFVIAIPARFL